MRIQAVVRYVLLALMLYVPATGMATDNFPPQAVFDGQPLLLNGKGTRNKFVLNVYTAGLYLQVKSSETQAILNGKQPVALRLEITSDLVSSEKMEQAVRDGFRRSAGNNSALTERIETLVNTFRQPIREGDIYDFLYRPENTLVIKNGVNAANIPGADFARAFFSIWLGENPVQASLKEALLGKR